MQKRLISQTKIRKTQSQSTFTRLENNSQQPIFELPLLLFKKQSIKIDKNKKEKTASNDFCLPNLINNIEKYKKTGTMSSYDFTIFYITDARAKKIFCLKIERVAFTFAFTLQRRIFFSLIND